LAIKEEEICQSCDLSYSNVMWLWVLNVYQVQHEGLITLSDLIMTLSKGILAPTGWWETQAEKEQVTHLKPQGL
jgi:hypothetical protein